MRIAIVPVALAALASASLAAAHSWSEATVVGTILPGTARCVGSTCTATVRAERVTTLHDGTSGTAGEVDVSFAPETMFGDRLRAETWADAGAALAGMSNARVRLLGDLDGLDGRTVLLHTRRAVRVSVVAPPSELRAAALFPACGRPPWSQATLEQCHAPDRASRRVSVKATLENDAYAHKPDLSWAIVLDLEDVSVDGGSGAVEPPAAHETGLVKGGLRFLDPGGKRPLPSTLRAGDRVTLGGTFEVPAPKTTGSGGGWSCFAAACWPRLVVDQVTVVTASPARR